MRHILVVNAGSATVKCALYELDHVRLADGAAGWRATFDRRDGAGLPAVADVLDVLPCDPDELAAVGHRIVHGGPRLRGPVMVDRDVRTHIEQAGRFAPLHNPPALALLDAFNERLPEAITVAVFDTAFHATIPPAAAAYGGPYSWWDRGWRRYGFHGISHRDAGERAARLIGRPLEDLSMVSTHLGGGCSVTAIRHGHSVDTTMGLSPLDGLVMATRSGSVDPAVVLLALDDHGGDPVALARQLEEGSGVLGLSGTTADVTEARIAAADGDERARLAYDTFVHRTRTAIGAMAVAAGGCDLLVLTGGAAERDASLRDDVVAGLGVLGLSLDAAANEAGAADRLINAESSPSIALIAADEERVIARETARLVGH
ncbi:MAG: acetate/propionate family kinase, partial [Acidimicrobiia bacterium]